MDEQRVQDQLRRIEVVAKLDRAQEIIDQYAEHVKVQHTKLRELSHELGMLDERLGGKP